MNLVEGSEKALNVVLVSKEYREFRVTTIKPYKDEKYKLVNCYVDINSKMIDKDTVACFAGMDEIFDAEEFAAACVAYYGENFWGGKAYILTKEEAEEKLKELLEA